MPVRARFLRMMMVVCWFALRNKALVPEFAQISHSHHQCPEPEEHQKDGGVAAEFTLDWCCVDRADGQDRE